jgi:BirA family transcriptional regulator, biotin operon repressor / biotin---[acetyl-CoA-carboxylase] ligase
MRDASFPPLLSGLPVAGEADPLDAAIAQAALGCDAGLVVYNLGASELRASIIFAPEVPLEDAMAMLPACGIGFQNALGALAPPEVAVHLDWAGGIQVNGAACGRLRAISATADPAQVPDWLVIGLELPLWPASDGPGTDDLASDGQGSDRLGSDRLGSDRPGDTPDQTALYAEGCADVDAKALLESWARHTLVWINRWSDEGAAPLHSEWRGLVPGIGEETRQGALSGTFLGVDERFGMLLRDQEGTTHLIPLSSQLEVLS